MPRRMLVVSTDNQPKPLLKLEVLNADMPHPGWMRFELEAAAPDWEEPTVCWYRIPPEATSVELQSAVTDADVMAAAAPPDARANADARRRSLFAQPHSSACICRYCTALDEQPGGDRGQG